MAANFTEGLSLTIDLATAHYNYLPSNRNLNNLVIRTRFYQAASILRLARNGWLSCQDRLVLDLQAFQNR